VDFAQIGVMHNVTVSSGVLQQTSTHGQLQGKTGPDARGITGLYTRTGGTIPTDRHAQRHLTTIRPPDVLPGHSTLSEGKDRGRMSPASGLHTTLSQYWRAQHNTK